MRRLRVDRDGHAADECVAGARAGRARCAAAWPPRSTVVPPRARAATSTRAGRRPPRPPVPATPRRRAARARWAASDTRRARRATSPATPVVARRRSRCTRPRPSHRPRRAGAGRAVPAGSRRAGRHCRPGRSLPQQQAATNDRDDRRRMALSSCRTRRGGRTRTGS